MSEDPTLSSSTKDDGEANLGHVNLAVQEIGDDSGLEHDGTKQLPELKQEEIEGEILENDEEQNSEEWWNYVQALVKNEENENNGNIPTRYMIFTVFFLHAALFTDVITKGSNI